MIKQIILLCTIPYLSLFPQNNEVTLEKTVALYFIGADPCWCIHTRAAEGYGWSHDLIRFVGVQINI